MRTWLKVTAALPGIPDDWSMWTERFARNGLPGTVQTDDPPTLSAYVPPGDESVLAPLRSDLECFGAKVTTEEVEEIDWSETWKQYFKPMAVAERIWIRPSWEEALTPDGRIEIVIDPGQAFGTGDHPTTRMCLQLLETEVVPGCTVADIGCGSGILSIAALRLGAKNVLAVDSDHLSVEATIENAELNGVEVSTFQGYGFEPLPSVRFDIVVSNIISAAIIGLAREASERIQDKWIVSGIIEANWPDVNEVVESSGFRVERLIQEGDWVAATLVRIENDDE